MNEEKTKAMPDDACCSDKKKSANDQKTGLIAFGVGIGAAILASLCCAGPLLAVVLGVSGAVALAGLGKYHAYFLLAAALLLIAGGVYIWRRQTSCPATEGKGKGFWAPLLVSFAVFGLLTLGINQLVIPYLSAKSSDGATAPTATPVALRQATFTIDGMTCSGCAGTIQAALAHVPGVNQARVSFEDKQALVVYDPSRTNPDKLIAVIAETHYTARLIKDEAK